MVLVVVLVGLLTALLAPSLAEVRHAALGTRTIANLRSHAQVFTEYGNDFQDFLPFLTDPHATFTVLRCPSRDLAVEVLYFDVAEYWHIQLADDYYGGDPFSEVFGAAGAERPTRPKGWVLYPYSFISAPDYWDLARRTGLPGQLGPNRHDAVLFPAAKSLLLSQGAQPEEGPRGRHAPPQPAAFVDGRAERVPAGRVAERGPFEHGALGVFTWRPPGGFAGVGMFYTLNGVRGRDVH